MRYGFWRILVVSMGGRRSVLEGLGKLQRLAQQFLNPLEGFLEDHRAYCFVPERMAKRQAAPMFVFL